MEGFDETHPNLLNHDNHDGADSAFFLILALTDAATADWSHQNIPCRS